FPSSSGLPLGYLEYAEAARHQIAEIQDPTTPCGIIRVAALCDLCRYRHNSHWTGHPSRLSRDQSGRFGSPEYGREELCAEMTSAFVCAALGIEPSVRHADYLGSWLAILREDNRAIVRAASAASKAADFLLAFGRAEEEALDLARAA
ncbi:MAG: zincin-like metallopeptidase domain-containing protein, partial [Sphingobium sp.]|nr:zincin-like metallopeptidase domain-containing protein [Sphingobium sp.]MCI1270746.1 zincin-like metallopeptidase domain-containing protein [Sphingobium sp.]